MVTEASALKADLSRDGRGYHVLRATVSHTLGVAEDNDDATTQEDDFSVIINQAKVETFDIQSKTVPSLLGGKGGRRGRVSMTWFENHPAPPPVLEGPASAEFCELAFLRSAVQHGLNHIFTGRFDTVMGPTLLRTFGRCRQQLVHVDKLRPRLMDETCLVALVQVALRDAELVMYPGSHRHLPDEETGKMTAVIHPVMLSSRTRNVHVFWQDVTHARAASAGADPRHRWHWYIDGGVPDAK